jgi:VIT1/CCC1 family predicted Fe2+/Mn2+ transporter
VNPTPPRLIADLLPSPLSSAQTASELDTLRQRLTQEVLSSTAVKLTQADLVGAAGVFLLVFLSTFPMVIPLIVVRQPRLALGLSNTVAVLMLFALGWSLGRTPEGLAGGAA